MQALVGIFLWNKQIKPKTDKFKYKKPNKAIIIMAIIITVIIIIIIIIIYIVFNAI